MDRRSKNWIRGDCFFMYEFLGLLCLVSLISIVVFTIMYFVGRRKNAKRAKRRALYAWISLAVLIFSAWGINQTPEGKQEATVEKVKSTPLHLTNVPSDGKVKSNSNAEFTIKGKTSKKASISLSDGSRVKKDNGKFEITTNVPYDESSAKYTLTIKAPKMKASNRSITVYNNSTGFKARMKKESSQQKNIQRKENIKKAEKAKQDSINAKKESQRESQKAAKKAATARKNRLNSRYKPVSLASFAEDPIKYDEKFISTTGNVIYIQKNPDDNNMYYVVIVPTDEYTTSGMSDGHGTVTEIDIDTMKAHPIHEGDTITVKGSGLTNTVTLNGKTLKSDIIVDYVKVD